MISPTKGASTPISLLDSVRQSDEVSLIAQLREYPNKAHEVDQFGDSALHYAARWGKTPICMILIEYGADVNLEDLNRFTPLHCAASFGHKDCVDLLIAKGATLDTTDKNLSTSLHYACHYNRFDTAVSLISHGADIKKRNADGKTCFELMQDWAMRSELEDIAESNNNVLMNSQTQIERKNPMEEKVGAHSKSETQENVIVKEYDTESVLKYEESLHEQQEKHTKECPMPKEDKIIVETTVVNKDEHCSNGIDNNNNNNNNKNQKEDHVKPNVKDDTIENNRNHREKNSEYLDSQSANSKESLNGLEWFLVATFFISIFVHFSTSWRSYV